ASPRAPTRGLHPTPDALRRHPDARPGRPAGDPGPAVPEHLRRRPAVPAPLAGAADRRQRQQHAVLPPRLVPALAARHLAGAAADAVVRPHAGDAGRHVLGLAADPAPPHRGGGGRAAAQRANHPVGPECRRGRRRVPYPDRGAGAVGPVVEVAAGVRGRRLGGHAVHAGPAAAAAAGADFFATGDCLGPDLVVLDQYCRQRTPGNPRKSSFVAQPGACRSLAGGGGGPVGHGVRLGPAGRAVGAAGGRGRRRRRPAGSRPATRPPRRRPACWRRTPASTCSATPARASSSPRRWSPATASTWRRRTGRSAPSAPSTASTATA